METDDWSLGFSDKEGDKFAINFEPGENGLHERKYTELGFSIFGTLSEVCDFHWLGDKTTYNSPNPLNKPITPPKSLRIYDETEDTVHISSIVPDSDGILNNILPNGIVARVDEEDRPFYVDINGDRSEEHTSEL